MSTSLSIYIPTYNRPNELRAQLETLAAQVDERVNVFVNDNCSEQYDIHSMAKEFDSERFHFSRNAVNIGGNANICLAYSLAGSSDYLWILSDNDLLVQNSLTVVFRILSSEPDLVIFNKTKQDNRILEPPNTGWVEGCPGLISEGILRSEVFVPYAEVGFRYHNSSFPHLAVYYAAKQRRAVTCFYSAERIFQEQRNLGGHIGNYDLSVAGMPQLSFLFPKGRARRRFLRGWMRDIGLMHYDLRNSSLEGTVFTSRKLLWSAIPVSMFWFHLRRPFRHLKSFLSNVLRFVRTVLKRLIRAFT